MVTKSNSITKKAEEKAVEVVVDSLLKKLNKENREEEYLKMLDLAKKYYGKGLTKERYEQIKSIIKNPDNRWMKFINKVLDETHPHIAKKTIVNLGYNAFFKGTKTIRKNREKYHCNIPWLILFDPTSACNMHCKGCWAGTYGNKYSLSFEDMDKIVSEGKKLGVYLYMLTGGEPLVKKKDILKLAKKHNDVEFSVYTNSSLIDEEFCIAVQNLGNIVFQLSIEGFEETNDGRRGEGHFKNVMKTMKLMKKYGLLFGSSICYTKDNIEVVTSDEFLNMLAENGVRYSFYFHYMPVGNNAVSELMPTMKQRKDMIKRIREIRSDKSNIELFPMDFQNDGEFVGGCIAAGRNYFHINSAGDAEPCVFIHYSDSNIKDKSILEILQSPLFMAYYNEQPFNRNHLRPCPMLENPDMLRKIVKDTNAKSTDLESPEDVDHLCSKCDKYAACWAKEADKIWNKKEHNNKGKYQNYAPHRRDNE